MTATFWAPVHRKGGEGHSISPSPMRWPPTFSPGEARRRVRGCPRSEHLLSARASISRRLAAPMPKRASAGSSKAGSGRAPMFGPDVRRALVADTRRACRHEHEPAAALRRSGPRRPDVGRHCELERRAAASICCCAIRNPVAPAGIEKRAQCGFRPGWRVSTLDRILVCPGAQGALLAVTGVLAAPGDTICAEALTYPGFRSVAAHLRIELVGVPIDERGPDA